MPRYALLILSGIAAVAAIFRLIALDYAPAGGHGDVAWIGINALDWIDNGIWPFYVRELYSPEFFPVYLTGLLIPVTGVSFLPQRLITAFAGVLFVLFLYPATWWLLYDRPQNFRVNAGLLASLAAALSLHVIALNRLGMESPPFLTVLALLVWFTAKAWHCGGYGRWALAGVALALAQYVFLAARLLPIVLVLWIVYSWWTHRDHLREQWRGWLVMAVVSFIITLPALILFITTPEAFSARADAGTAETGGWIWQFDTSGFGGPLGLIAQKFVLTIMAFGIYWDGPYNIMNLPMLGPLFFLGFLVALPFTVRNFRRIGYGWPLLAIPVMLITDLISGAVLEIHALHQMGVLPFVYILAGIGLAHLWELITLRFNLNWMRYGLIAVMIAAAFVPAATRMHNYLTVVIPEQYSDPESSWRRAQTDVDLGQYLVENADRSFLLPHSEFTRSDVAWIISEGYRYRHSAIDSEGTLTIENIPNVLTVVLPDDPERPRHDGFPAQYDPRLWVLLHDNQIWLLPPLTDAQTATVNRAQAEEAIDSLVDRRGEEIAHFYLVPTPEQILSARSVIDYPVDVTFNDEIRLIGYSLPSQELQSGEVTFISLFWQSLKAPSEDYEIFVQFWDDEQSSIGGAHDFPYGGMYRTRIWKTDEIVPTHHWIQVPENLSVGRYSLVVGLYRLLHNENLPVEGADADATLQIARIPQLRYPPPPPTTTGTPPEVSLTFDDMLAVKGLDVSLDGGEMLTDTWRVSSGDVLLVDIVWEALTNIDSDYSLFLHVSTDDSEPPVFQIDTEIGDNFPTGAWQEGDLVRDSLRLPLPDTLPAGRYDLLLGVYFWQSGERLPASVGEQVQPDSRIKLGEIAVEE